MHPPLLGACSGQREEDPGETGARPAMPPDEHILQHRHLIEQPLVLECAGEPERGDGVGGSPESARACRGRSGCCRRSRRKMPVTRLKIVVLPDPFGPISPTISPSFIRKSKPWTACSPPNVFLSPVASSSAIAEAAEPIVRY